jgi:hypothetical protein
VTQRQYPYSDDSVYSKSKEQHWEHLLALFSIPITNRSALNLGHHISTTNVAPLWDNFQFILDFPTPTDCKALHGS